MKKNHTITIAVLCGLFLAGAAWAGKNATGSFHPTRVIAPHSLPNTNVPGGDARIPSTDTKRPEEATPGNVAPIEDASGTVDESPLIILSDIRNPRGQSTSAVSSPWRSLNGGGAPASGSGKRANGSIGQSAIGTASSPNYRGQIGFWYSAFRPASVCRCACHADPKCDSVSDVFDVVHMVNVAFRNGADFVDADCPKTRTDVNCDNVTDVFDVVHMVNVAFRNGNASTEFCDPCGGAATANSR